jgi:choline dehydrogenase-like flavoprotein
MERNKSEVFSESDSDLLKSKTWNYIIIGTGMGGGPIGLRLAQAGFSVLFVEKGSSLKRPDSIRGEFPEMKEGNQKQLLQKGGALS